jgi:hypothetical protein
MLGEQRRYASWEVILGVLLEDSCEYIHMNLLTVEFICAQRMLEDLCESPQGTKSLPGVRGCPPPHSFSYGPQVRKHSSNLVIKYMCIHFIFFRSIVFLLNNTYELL